MELIVIGVIGVLLLGDAAHLMPPVHTQGNEHGPG